jgi:hypothetical protein
MSPDPSLADLGDRLTRLSEHGKALEAEGLPYPTQQIRSTVEAAIQHGALSEALSVLKRSESLYAVAARDWGWVKQTLARAEELRGLAGTIGLDMAHLDSRVGNAREQLKAQPLSAASLGRAAASASLAVAVLHDAIPKYCIQESQKLGESIRAARNRGEDVTEAVRAFARLLQAVQDAQIVQTATLLVQVRHAVARIPRAPAMAIPSEEEEEILMEARNLARRLQRIKSKARNAQNAARLMTQVRAALSEERRVGTPEEEIEALWDEVDRLAKERTADDTEIAQAAEAGVPTAAAAEEPASADTAPEEEANENEDTTGFGHGLVPPAELPAEATRRRGRAPRDPPP